VRCETLILPASWGVQPGGPEFMHPTRLDQLHALIRIHLGAVARPSTPFSRAAQRGDDGAGVRLFGPHVLVSQAGERLFGAAVAGKPASVLGDPDAPHTFTFIDDFASALVTLGAREEALGEVWHVPSAQTLSYARVRPARLRRARAQAAPPRRTFGAHPTPHAEAIRDTVGWYRTRSEPGNPGEGLATPGSTPPH
jgi:hypothetical protein